MKCKNHPNTDAKYFCTSCGIPICADCTEESPSGDHYCFQCAMLHSISQVGSSLVEKRDKASNKKLEKKKKWGPFQYFVIVSCVLIAVMWGVIILGGQTAPGSKVDFANNQRIFLFMIDSAIKRYAHFENNVYPERLTDIVPEYLNLSDEEIVLLKDLSYLKDPTIGYSLSLINPKPGEMKITITPKGLQYEPL